jgi:hypothetical protein
MSRFLSCWHLMYGLLLKHTQHKVSCRFDVSVLIMQSQKVILLRPCTNGSVVGLWIPRNNRGTIFSQSYPFLPFLLAGPPHVLRMGPIFIAYGPTSCCCIALYYIYYYMMLSSKLVQPIVVKLDEGRLHKGIFGCKLLPF